MKRSLSFGALELRPSDWPMLRPLLPVFALVTGANVVSMSFGRAIFIGNNPYEALPWMFLAAAGFVALLTLGYVRLIGRVALRTRFQGLLGLAAISFMALAVCVDSDPAGWSIVAFTWCAGMGQLAIIQAWGWSTALLPVRLARRLFPVLAASATAGAAIGGGLTTALLPIGGLPGLLLVAACLYLAAFVVIGRARRTLQRLRRGPGREAVADHEARSPGSLMASLRTVLREPLLLQLAVLAVFMQGASVLLDFQFASALKHTWQADEIASFLGAYYGLANALTFVVALWFGSRLVRFLGVGLAAGAAAIPLVIGSVVALSWAGDGGGLVWVVIATSFGERVLAFGVARHAAAAALTPVDPRLAERARFVIDGVGLRLATALVSGGLLLASSALEDFELLSPWVLVVSSLVVIVAWRLRGVYRRTLVSVLRGSSTGPVDAGAVRRWTQREARASLAEVLAGSDAEGVLAGLRSARQLGIRAPQASLEALLAHEEHTVVVAALRACEDSGFVLGEDVLGPLLGPSQIQPILVAALRVAPTASSLDVLVKDLAEHPSALVVCLALRWRAQAGLCDGTAPRSWQRVERFMMGKEPPPRDDPAGVLASFLHSLPMLLAHPDPEMRQQAESAMGALRIPALAGLLIGALETPVAVPAHAALLAMGAEVVQPALSVCLKEPEGPRQEVTVLGQLRLAERLGCRDILIQALAFRSGVVRDFAVSALWRLARELSNVVPRPTLLTHARREIEALGVIGALADAFSNEPTGRVGFFARELRIRLARTEVRVFRLLGLLYGRARVQRAVDHYRSVDPRERSNAIELLDTVVRESALRPLLGYLEREESTNPEASLLSEQHDVAALEAVDPWLASLYRWALGGTVDGVADAEMDRALLLHRIPLFAGTPADQLLGIAAACRQVLFAAQDEIFRPGDAARHLYVVERGTVSIERDGKEVVSFGAGDCFGELAILADAVRDTTARAVSDVDCLVLSREDFQGLVDSSPELARGTISVLADRLRHLLQRQS